MNVKLKSALLISTILTATNAIAQNSVSVNSIAQFEYNTDKQVDGELEFAEAYSPECNSYYTNTDRLCSDRNVTFLYSSSSTWRTKDFKRHGVFYPASNLGIEGNALKVTLTGGVDKDANGNFITYGSTITNYRDYIDNGLDKRPVKDSYLLPGSPSLYVKPKFNESGSLEMFGKANRFSVYVWYPESKDSNKRYSRASKEITAPYPTLAWYPFLDTPKSGHYYHHAYNRAYGTWIKYTFDAHPVHNNMRFFENDITKALSEGGYDRQKGDYFDRIAAFAVRFQEAEDKPSPYEFLTDKWESYYVDYENEETIISLSMGYDPTEKGFDISFEDKYRCGNCDAEYEVKYSFSPITNQNYDSAKSIVSTENFFIEDDNQLNRIVKPHPGYNQIWAKIFLKDGDIERYESGARVYFAVKDKSQRTNFETSPTDYEVVRLPNGDSKYKKDLIKTISMDYFGKKYESNVKIPSEIHMSSGEEIEIPFQFHKLLTKQPVNVSYSGNIVAEATDTVGGQGVNIRALGKGKGSITLTTSDYYGKITSKDTFTVYVDEDTCATSMPCGMSNLVTLTSASATTNVAELSSVYHDRYSGFDREGFGIKVGRNGAYNYVGVKGEGVQLNEGDFLSLTVKNISGSLQETAPFISAVSSNRRIYDENIDWTQLRVKTLSNNETETWLFPVTAIYPDAFVDNINVSIGNNTTGMVLQSIDILSKESIACNPCEQNLVDFYGDSGKHLTGISGWSNVLQDRYDGVVGNGVGIIAGKNNAYTYQGVSGDHNLKDHGDTIKIYWENTGNTTISFTPNVSYDDPDRIVHGAKGNWETTDLVTVPPGQVVTQEITLPSRSINMINVNSNYSGYKVLSMNKMSILK